MAQATSLSVPQGRRQTSFLSFDDTSPNPAHVNDLGTAHTQLASSTNTIAPSETNRSSTPTSPKRWSGSVHSSPSKVSRLIRSRPGSSRDLAAAASTSGGASNHSEPQPSSSTRSSPKQPGSSRGSRLGALLGRNLLSNDAPYSRNDSSSTNQTESLPTNTQQTRIGRLGRLAYKKDDSIAFIAQSRNASQQTAAGAHGNPDASDTHHQWSASSRLSASGATQGLGIEDFGGPYASQRSSNSSYTAAAQLSTFRYDGLGNGGASDYPADVASARVSHRPTSSSSNVTSRAPSAAATHAANYHNRFSRQGLSQELEQDLSHDSEAQASRSSAEAQAAPSMASGSAYERSSRSPRGTLSDAAIAELGAMPGASAVSLLNSNGAPLSSKNILTIALQKAQNAVQLDSANNVPEAIAAYKQAVRLLEEVMERIAPRSNKRSRPSREEERRRLRVIHDTYADRVRLLSMIYSPEIGATDEIEGAVYDDIQQQTANREDWLDRVRDDSQHSPMIDTPRMDEVYLDAKPQRSPRDDTGSFLSITLVGTTLAGSSRDANAQSMQSAQRPFPRSPPVPNTPLSPVANATNTSPRRRIRDHARPSSRDSHGSRVSVSHSIADEQEAQDYRLPPPVIAEELPRLSMDGVLPSDTKERLSSPKKVQLRDAVAQVRNTEAQQHGPSDSDSSFKSPATALRLEPVSTLPHRAFGLEEEARTPNTAYFDASADSGPVHERRLASVDAAEAQVRQQQSSQTPTSTAPVEIPAMDKPAEKPARMGLAQRARALSFKGPSLRQKMSLPSLGERKKEDAAAGSTAVPALPNIRPDFAATPSNEILSSTLALPAPWDEGPGSDITVRQGQNRARASSSAALVSASTAAGTISQRRKNAQEDRDGQGVFGELDGPGVMDDESSRPRSIAMTSRQRSTSQSGTKRPSIPAAFVSANASALNGTGTVMSGEGANGEGLPPPVPDLARTLSALDLKRANDEPKAGDADASFVAGDMSISTLAMPLPQPHTETDMALDGTQRFLIADIFPTGLPSLAAGAPSYASAALSQPAPLSPHLPTPPHPLLKPFYTLHALRLSILSGSQLTPTLYLSRSIWRQPGVKLLGIETKIRAIELLVTGLDSLDKGGEALLMPLGSGAGLETSSGTRFLRCLDEWETILNEVQASLVKKLAFLDTHPVGVGGGGGGGGKKSFAGLGSRFTRSIDRLAGGGKSIDATSITAYTDSLSRLFTKCTTLGTHLRWVLVAEGTLPLPEKLPTNGGVMPSPTGIGIAHANKTAYFALPDKIRHEIKTRLTTSSDWFARVVLVWVLQDVAMLVERALKKSASGFE